MPTIVMLAGVSITSVAAAQRWAAELAAWTIDPDILAAAPESPYGFPPALFAADRSAQSPVVSLASPALRSGGTVLDVGAGAGGASLPLAPGHLHAVDSQPSMLLALAGAAAQAGVSVTTYDGEWPGIADQVPVCDIVVCAHVAYNVPDLPAFARALTSHARVLVVMELHHEHPWVPLGPLWLAVHQQQRPDGPTAALAVQVLAEAGIVAEVTEWVRPAPDLTGELFPAYVDFTRRRLCLPADRTDEVTTLVRRYPPRSRRSVVLSWRPPEPRPGGLAAFVTDE